MLVGFAASSSREKRDFARCASLLRRPRVAEALAEAQVASATKAERATHERSERRIEIIYDHIVNIEKYETMNTAEKIERLEKVLEKIELDSRDDGNFNDLVKLLNEEFELELYVKEGSYTADLRRTFQKEGMAYKIMKRRGRPKQLPTDHYPNFISKFKESVAKELSRIRLLP